MSQQTIGGTPVLILKEGTGRSTGKEAQRNNITAAKIIAETVRTTLGPRGMDKMLVSTIGDVTITNDGATIMKELDVQHPAAKMLVEVSKTQDNEVGDGTTTAVLLSGELLERAEKLLDKDVHPTVIVDGYKKAAEKAIEILDKLSFPVTEKDDATLRQVAMTSMYSKGIVVAKEHFADIAVKAVKQVSDKVDGKIRADIDLIKIVKKHGKGLEETELVKGIVVDKEISHAQMPKKIELAKIALLNAKVENEKREFGAKININNSDQMHPFIEEEEKMLKDMVQQIAKRLREYKVKLGGREQLAIEAFAEAMEAVPTTLAENAGLDPIDILVELRSKHERAANPWFGVDVYSGEIKDMKKLNVLEPLRVKQQVVKSASEAASMILRIDDVIASKGVDKGGPGGGKDSPMPGGDDEY